LFPVSRKHRPAPGCGELTRTVCKASDPRRRKPGRHPGPRQFRLASGGPVGQGCPMKFPLLFLATLLAITPATMAAERLKILIIDGQNNHDWRASTPHLKKVLEASGRFTIEVATTPG